MKFRDWYVARHGVYPSAGGEDYSVIFQRMADSFADYVDEAVQEQAKAPAPVFKPQPEPVDWTGSEPANVFRQDDDGA